jgi:hypothetical protein
MVKESQPEDKRLLEPGWAGQLNEGEAEYIARELKASMGLKITWQLKEFRRATHRGRMQIGPWLVRALSQWWQNRPSVPVQLPLRQNGRAQAHRAKQKDRDNQGKRSGMTPAPNGYVQMATVAGLRKSNSYWVPGTGVFMLDGWAWGVNRLGETHHDGGQNILPSHHPTIE